MVNRLAVPKWEIEMILDYLAVQKRGPREDLILRLLREREMFRDFLKIAARDIRAMMWYCPGGTREMFGKSAKMLEEIVDGE